MNPIRYYVGPSAHLLPDPEGWVVYWPDYLSLKERLTLVQDTNTRLQEQLSDMKAHLEDLRESFDTQD